QRDVDGELAVALHEFAGAIQWIDQPVALPRATRVPVDVLRFLGQHGDVRCQFLQPVDDDAMRGHVRGGQRRIVGLVLDREAARVYFQDGRTRAARELAGFERKTFQGAHAGRNLPSRYSRAMNSAAMDRPSDTSSRASSAGNSDNFHGTTSRRSGSSPGRLCGYKSSARITCALWVM